MFDDIDILKFNDGLCLKIKEYTILLKGNVECFEIHDQKLNESKIEKFFKPLEYYGTFGSEKAMERYELMKSFSDSLNIKAKDYWFKFWMNEDFEKCKRDGKCQE